jgi:hypothetical protein
VDDENFMAVMQRKNAHIRAPPYENVLSIKSKDKLDALRGLIRLVKAESPIKEQELDRNDDDGHEI